MPKAKLTVENFQKLELVAELSDVKIEKVTKVQDEHFVQVNAKNPAQLFDMGRRFGSLPENAKLPEKKEPSKN